MSETESPPAGRLKPGRGILLERGIGFVRAVARSDFGGNAFWYTALQGAERVVAVVQTVILSRMLGAHDYGVYGMLFATLGLVSSIAGLQAGLTATVFISRYLPTDKAKVAGVITMVERFGAITGIALTIALLPFYHQIAGQLLHQPGYDGVVLIALLFIAATIVSGIQDGIAQGFEAFSYLARLKLVLAIFSIMLLLPSALYFGLNGVFLVLLGAIIAKFVVLAVRIRSLRRSAGVPTRGSPVSFVQIMLNFALPSLAASFVFGWASWSGLYLLSSSSAGLIGVALVNVALQWRGPAQLITSSLSNVAVPMFSRHTGSNDLVGADRLRRRLLWATGAIATATTIPLALAGPLLMRLYGPDFTGGALPFALILMSTVPYALANVYMQQLVGGAQMWRQLWIQLPYCALLAISFFVLVPRFEGLGYAAAMLFSNISFLFIVMFMRSAK